MKASVLTLHARSLAEACRDTEVPEDPFDRDALMVAALRVGHELLTLAERIHRHNAEVAEAWATFQPTKPPPQPSPPPPPQPAPPPKDAA